MCRSGGQCSSLGTARLVGLKPEIYEAAVTAGQ